MIAGAAGLTIMIVAERAQSSRALRLPDRLRNMDRLTPEQRSRLMPQIRGTNTAPELAVRRALHRLGFRYRLHARSLPGSPDLVFPKLGKIVFVHGCFWHGHDCKQGRSISKSNVEFWTEKIR